MLDLLHIATTLLIGLFAGALLTEACVLVPYWRRMEPTEFYRLHGTIGPSLFRYFAPLTVVAVALSVVSAGLGIGGGVSASAGDAPEHIWRMVAAGLCVTTLIIFFGFFKAANARLSAHTIPDDKLGRALARWARWHWLRTVIAIAALAFSIASHS